MVGGRWSVVGVGLGLSHDAASHSVPASSDCAYCRTTVSCALIFISICFIVIITLQGSYITSFLVIILCVNY